MPLKTQQEINDIFAQKKEDRLKFFIKIVTLIAFSNFHGCLS